MNHRILMSEIKELVTMEHSSRFKYRRLNVCETWVSSTLIYRFNIPSGLFVKSNNLFLKLIWRSQKCGVANHNLEGWSWRSGTAQLQFLSKSCINQSEMLIRRKIRLGEHNGGLQNRSNKYIQLVSGGNGKDNSTKKDNLLNEWYHDAYTPGERKRGRSRGREMNLDVDLVLILPQSRQ